MKLLVFGGAGQVGKEVLLRLPDTTVVRSPTYEELDITDEQLVYDYVRAYEPTHILNLAAYTQVDKAEEEVERAAQVNGYAAGFIAKAAHVVQARLVHVSTDYVFPGTGSSPLEEDQPVDPVNEYGRSKLLGEQQVIREAPEKSLVVRTSSVHGAHGPNFVDTMLALFLKKDRLSVVDDQIMSPTWAGWLGETLLALCARQETGIVHACSGAAITWYQFAEKIQELATAVDTAYGNVELVPVPATEFPRPAARPAYSVMSVARLESMLGGSVCTWGDGLRAHLMDKGLLPKLSDSAVNA